MYNKVKLVTMSMTTLPFKSIFTEDLQGVASKYDQGRTAWQGHSNLTLPFAVGTLPIFLHTSKHYWYVFQYKLTTGWSQIVNNSLLDLMFELKYKLMMQLMKVKMDQMNYSQNLAHDLMTRCELIRGLVPQEVLPVSYSSGQRENFKTKWMIN